MEAGTREQPEAHRRRLIELLRREAAEVRHEGYPLELDERVLDAMLHVAREQFVPPALAGQAYINAPLPIGDGQTISQPFIVALMSSLLQVGPDSKILEVGTGSGYQAAVLAKLVAKVYSIERLPSLADSARRHLAGLGIDNVSVTVGDGARGWPEHAPYDGIIVTAAPRTVPSPLQEQLAPGARLVIPVGEQPWGQQLLVCEKRSDGSIQRHDILPVAFVPLVSD